MCLQISLLGQSLCIFLQISKITNLDIGFDQQKTVGILKKSKIADL